MLPPQFSLPSLQKEPSCPVHCFPNPTGWGQLCPVLEALGQSGLSPLGPPALLAQDGHTGPLAVDRAGKQRGPVLLAVSPWSLAPAIAITAAASPFAI